VRYRLMAAYQGSLYEAGIGPADSDIVLFAACPPPEALGFEPATGHWRKQLAITDVQAVWESRPVGRFRGERCIVLDDLGDRLHIGYLGHDGYQAEQLGYWQVDRGVFELVAPRSEVSDIMEDRVAYPPSAPARPQQAAGLQAAPTAGPTEPASHEPPGYERAAYEPMPRIADTGSWLAPDYGTYVPVPDDTTRVAVPTAAEAPLPVEAQALRAATASRRPRQPASEPKAAKAEHASGHSRQRRAARRRLATERLFADLAGQAGIPADAYAVGEEVEGALCLIQTEDGFEVFHSAEGARHELQVFQTEESACFYLFGVLAAEAVRTGSLVRLPTGQAVVRV
jgi:hypothetical protein